MQCAGVDGKKLYKVGVLVRKENARQRRSFQFLKKLKLLLEDKDSVVFIFLIDNGENRRMQLNRKKRDIGKAMKMDNEKVRKSKGMISKIRKSQEWKTLNKESSQLKESFTCDICGRALSTKANLQRHHSLKHSKAANF